MKKIVKLADLKKLTAADKSKVKGGMLPRMGT